MDARDWQAEHEALVNRLKPTEVGKYFCIAGFYLSIYELMKSNFVDRVIDYFADRYDDGPPIKSDSYTHNVAGLNPSEFIAVAIWYEKMEAITQRQVQTLRQLKISRDEIAHDSIRWFVDASRELPLSSFKELAEIFHAIENFWVSVEIGVDPEHPSHASSEEDSLPYSLSAAIVSLVGESVIEFLSFVDRSGLMMSLKCQECFAPTPASGEAYICTHECTFCKACAESMDRVCPNCSGELVRRPKPASEPENDS